MDIKSNAYKLRLKNEYEEMQKLPVNDLFKVIPAPGEDIPYVSRYRVIYTVPTWIKSSSGQIVKQNRTVVEVEKISLLDTPHAKVVEGSVPFHPNWFPNGTVCNGSAWVGTSMWLYEYIGFVCEVLQFKESRIDPNSPANHAARDYWVENRYNPNLFPTDTRPIPVPVEKPRAKIQIMNVKKN